MRDECLNLINQYKDFNIETKIKADDRYGISKKIFKHISSGREYIELSHNARIKEFNGFNHCWVDAVLYTNDSGIFFMRSVSEFDSRFVEVN